MAKRKYLVDLDLNGNQLLNSVFEKVATDPSTPLEGQFWFNETNDRPKVVASGVVKSLAYTDDVEVGSFAVDLDENEASVTRVFATGETTYTVTHGLATTDLVFNVVEQSSSESVGVKFLTTDANTAQVVFNGDSTNNSFRLTVKK